jgi:hypothetical protein
MADHPFTRPALRATTALAGARFRGLGAAAAEPETEANEPNASAEGGEDDEARKAKEKKAKDDAAKVKKAEDAKKAKREQKRKQRNRDAGREEDDDGEDGPVDDDDDADGDEDAEGDDDGDEDEMRKGNRKGSTGAIIRTARLRERARIAHIMESAAARLNPEAALKIALNTTLGRDRAVDLLESLPATAAAVDTTLDARMDRYDGRNAGIDAPKLSAAARIDADWDAVASRAAITVKKS